MPARHPGTTGRAPGRRPSHPLGRCPSVTGQAWPGRRNGPGGVYRGRGRRVRRNDLAVPGTAATPVPGCAACSSRKVLSATLLRAAERHNDAKAFDIYAATLEIDSIQDVPLQLAIAESLRQRWQNIVTGDWRTIEEAKLGLVLRFGEALGEVAGVIMAGPLTNNLRYRLPRESATRSAWQLPRRSGPEATRHSSRFAATLLTR